MKRHAQGKIVNLGEVATGRASAEELQRAVASTEDLAALHPAHAACVYTQNQASVMSEQLTALPEMEPFVEIVSNAEDLLMPSAPPMSPLTTSYFTCWALFDVCVGPAKETIGTTVLEVGAAFGMHRELLRLIRSMQESRMGLYTYEGVEGDLAVLREIGTGAVCRAVVPSGYAGQKGELWYVRVLPPPLPGGSEHVVFTTPYVVLRPGLAEWLAYFSRTFPGQRPVGVYERHMKYGPKHMYRPGYVFEACVNHRADAIDLAGLPDVPESRSRSEVNQWGVKQRSEQQSLRAQAPGSTVRFSPGNSPRAVPARFRQTASAGSPTRPCVTSSRAMAVGMSSPSSSACRPSVANFPSIAGDTSNSLPIGRRQDACTVSS